jgi:hypothetical protein
MINEGMRKKVVIAQKRQEVKDGEMWWQRRVLLCLSPSSPQEVRRGARCTLGDHPWAKRQWAARREEGACAAWPADHPDSPTISFHFLCIRCPPGLSPCLRERLSFRLLFLTW